MMVRYSCLLITKVFNNFSPDLIYKKKNRKYFLLLTLYKCRQVCPCIYFIANCGYSEFFLYISYNFEQFFTNKNGNLVMFRNEPITPHGFLLTKLKLLAA